MHLSSDALVGIDTTCFCSRPVEICTVHHGPSFFRPFETVLGIWQTRVCRIVFPFDRDSGMLPWVAVLVTLYSLSRVFMHTSSGG